MIEEMGMKLLIGKEIQIFCSMASMLFFIMLQRAYGTI